MRDFKQLAGKLPAFLDRYKYPALILLVGLAMVLWPSREQEAVQPAASAAPEIAELDPGEEYRARVEKDLAALLCQIDGAGKVKVMLTLKTGPTSAYQTDRESARSLEGDRESRSEEERTVIFQRGSAYDEPAIVSTAYPVFQGALIVAEGGGDPAVRYALSAAVSALLDLGADQITVVKMR